jgi:hypothetical protein
MPRSQTFVLRIVNKKGVPVDVSHYRPNSLLGAALVAHAFQEQDGCTATIMDTSVKPPKKYRVDERGKPIPI